MFGLANAVINATVPIDPSLVGTLLFVQALTEDPGAPGGASMTRAGRAVLGY